MRDARAGVLATVVGTAALVSIMAPFQGDIALLNAGFAFLLLTLLISARWGIRVGVFAAVVTNLALNFFFIEPLHTFSVRDPGNGFGLLAFLGVSVLGGSLLSNARAAEREAQRRADEMQVLLNLTRAMIGQTNPEDALTSLCHQVVEALHAPGAAVLGSAGDGVWRVHAWAGEASAARAPDRPEGIIAERALETGTVSRRGNMGTERVRRPRVVMPSGHRIEEMTEGVAFLPLRVGGQTYGVLRVDGPIGDTAFRDHPDRLLGAFASEAALGLQRAELARSAAHAEALMQADEMKTALMTSISHDLKTPLAGIKTAVTSLLDSSVEWTAEDREAFLETIDSQADRLNRVISDILDLNRIESGVVAPAIAAVPVQPLLEDARERTFIATRGRNVTIDAPSGLLVRADSSLVAQALVNLIENASKYSTAGTAIHLKARRGDSQRVELIVEDEGPGIAAVDLPHVFERFYRAADLNRRVKGSGLGLAIVKGFVTLSGGTVRVESSPAGTCFIISLPTAATSATAAA